VTTNLKRGSITYQWWRVRLVARPKWRENCPVPEPETTMTKIADLNVPILFTQCINSDLSRSSVAKSGRLSDNFPQIVVATALILGY
jgi:hypothetical protein